MSQGNSHDIRVLNGLAENLSDNAVTYREAMDEVDHSGYRLWFEARARERDAMAEDLRREVVQRGGTPDEETSILTKAQRAFMGIKQALLRNDTTLIDTIEFSEATLLERFTAALEDKHLSATTRETIRRAHSQVQATREQAAELRHSLERHPEIDNPLTRPEPS